MLVRESLSWMRSFLAVDEMSPSVGERKPAVDEM